VINFIGELAQQFFSLSQLPLVNLFLLAHSLARLLQLICVRPRLLFEPSELLSEHGVFIKNQLLLLQLKCLVGLKTHKLLVKLIVNFFTCM
jgi:hypothetical protein